MRISILAFVVLMFSSCGLVSSFKIRDAFQNEQIGLDSFKKEISFQEVNGVIIIKVRIQGIEENFVFDSAATTKIDEQLAKRLKYTSLGKKKTFDSNNKKRKIKYITLNELEVGSVPFHSIVATVSDLKELNKAACLNVSGILGVNVMNKGVWQIDFINHKIILTDNIDSLKFSGTESIVDFYSVGKGTPEISLRSNNAYLGEAILDTGFNGSIALNNNKAINYSNFVQKQYYSTGVFSSSLNEQKIVRIPSLQIGKSFKLSKPIVTLDEHKMAYSIIGTRFLKNYRTTIDWRSQQLILDRTDTSVDNPFDGFGIHPKLINNKIVVGVIYLNSSAYQQGIRLNDKILKIDEINFDKASHEKYCDLRAHLRHEDTKNILVVIQRGENKLNFKLQITNLVSSI